MLGLRRHSIGPERLASVERRRHRFCWVPLQRSPKGAVWRQVCAFFFALRQSYETKSISNAKRSNISDMALIQNNATVAAQIAVALSDLQSGRKSVSKPATADDAPRKLANVKQVPVSSE